MRISSAVMFVTQLERSVTFYERLLGVDCRVRTSDAALLVATGGDQIYLRAAGRHAQHPVGAVGVQYLIWTAADLSDLDRCEAILREESPRVSRRTVDGFELVEGIGLDGVPIMVSYPGPADLPRSGIIPRIYSW